MPIRHDRAAVAVALAGPDVVVMSEHVNGPVKLVAIPRTGGAARTLLSVPGGALGHEPNDLSASPQRVAAIVEVERTRKHPAGVARLLRGAVGPPAARAPDARPARRRVDTAQGQRRRRSDAARRGPRGRAWRRGATGCRPGARVDPRFLRLRTPVAWASGQRSSPGPTQPSSAMGRSGWRSPIWRRGAAGHADRPVRRRARGLARPIARGPARRRHAGGDRPRRRRPAAGQPGQLRPALRPAVRRRRAGRKSTTPATRSICSAATGRRSRSARRRWSLWTSTATRMAWRGCSTAASVTRP